MPLTVSLVLVVVFAFGVSRVMHRYAPNVLTVWSLEYLLVGVFVGPMGVELLDADDLRSLQPFVSLNLGLVGFALGLPLRRRVGSLRVLLFGLLASGATIAITGWAMSPLLAWVAPKDEQLWLSLVLGAAAAACSLQVIDSARSAFKARGATTDLLRSFAIASNVTAVCVAGLGLALERASTGSGRFGLPAPGWLVGSALLGLALGVLFWLFVGDDTEERTERTFLATVGVVIFASGLAAAIGISPLFLNLLAGIVVSLLPRTERLSVALIRLERPALILLLVFAGALLRLHVGLVLVLPLVYAVVRILALRVSTGVVRRLVPGVYAVPRFGEGVAAQGAIAAAIAVNFAQVNPEVGDVVMTVVLLGLVLADVTSVDGLRRLLADAGEVGHAEPPRPAPQSEAAS